MERFFNRTLLLLIVLIFSFSFECKSQEKENISTFFIDSLKSTSSFFFHDYTKYNNYEYASKKLDKNLYHQLGIHFSKDKYLDRDLSKHYEKIFREFNIHIEKLLINDKSSKFLQLIVSIDDLEEKKIEQLIFKELNRQLLPQQISQIKDGLNNDELDYLQNNFLIWKLQENADTKTQNYFTNIFKELNKRLKILEEIDQLNIDNASIERLTCLNDSLNLYKNTYQNIYQDFEKKAFEYSGRLNSLIISKNKYLIEFYLKTNDIVNAYKSYDIYCEKIKCQDFELLQLSSLKEKYDSIISIRNHSLANKYYLNTVNSFSNNKYYDCLTYIHKIKSLKLKDFEYEGKMLKYEKKSLNKIKKKGYDFFSNDTYMDSLRVDYFTGVSTGTNTTMKELKLQAIEDLVVQLNVNIKTETKFITEETNSQFNTLFYNNINVTSYGDFSNLFFIEQKSSDKTKIIALLNKADYIDFHEKRMLSYLEICSSTNYNNIPVEIKNKILQSYLIFKRYMNYKNVDIETKINKCCFY